MVEPLTLTPEPGKSGPAFTFQIEGVVVAVINHDGSVTVPDNIPADEAARKAAHAFWRCFGNGLRQRLADRG